MEFQRELAQKMRDDKGGRIGDPQPYVTALHELIHGALPGGHESAEWKALAPEDRAALSAFDGMDKANPSGGAYPTLHSLANAAKRDPEITQDAIDSLAGRGLLEKSASTSSYTDPRTGEMVGPYHSWMMTGKARDTIPAPAQTHAMHSKAYQDPTVASVEEGFTELGTVHHAPEFFAKMGLGDRETGVLSVDKAGHVRESLDATGAKMAETQASVGDLLERAKTAPGSAQAWLELRQARSALTAPGGADVSGVIDHLSKAAAVAGDEGLRADLNKLMQDIDVIPGTVRHATLAEYAKRLRDPERIAKGEAWQHYAWQTAAAQSGYRMRPRPRARGRSRRGSASWPMRSTGKGSAVRCPRWPGR